MNIKGNLITLDGNELATAIDTYLTAHNVHVSGPRTIRFIVGDDKHIADYVMGQVYVDPSGRVADNR